MMLSTSRTEGDGPAKECDRCWRVNDESALVGNASRSMQGKIIGKQKKEQRQAKQVGQ